MGSVTNFDYDIFISYAHNDNLPDTIRGKEGWVKSFCTLLKTDLIRAGFGEVTIWWDNRTLDGNDFFDAKIEEGIKKSAIFLCLNSLNYKKSDYCEKELEIFHSKATDEKEGLRIGHSSRIINVLLKDIPFEEWPEQFQGRSGFHFYEKVDEGVDWRTASILEFTNPSFNEEWKKLVATVFKLMEGMKHEVAETVQESTAPGSSEKEFTVYFADAPESLVSARQKVISSLEKKGYNIVLNDQEARTSEAHEAATKEAIDKSHLVVHLFDQSPGFPIDDQPDNWYRTRQVEIALETDIPQLIWMDSLVPVESIRDDKYREFVESVETGSISEKDYEFIVGNYSNITNNILEYIKSLEKKLKSQNKKSEVNAHVEMDVLLDYNTEDKMYALELQKSFEKHNLVTHYAPIGRDPEKNKRILQNRLNEVKKLVFLYGKSSKDWVKSRLETAVTKLMFEESPVEDIFVFMTPPEKEPSDLIPRHAPVKVNFINHSSHTDVNDQLIEEFMNDLIGEEDA